MTVLPRRLAEDNDEVAREVVVVGLVYCCSAIAITSLLLASSSQTLYPVEKAPNLA